MPICVTLIVKIWLGSEWLLQTPSASGSQYSTCSQLRIMAVQYLLTARVAAKNFVFVFSRNYSRNYQFRISRNFSLVSRKFRETRNWNLCEMFAKFEGNFEEQESTFTSFFKFFSENPKLNLRTVRSEYSNT